MKKTLFIIAALATFCLGVESCKKVLPAAALPQGIRDFVQTHFAGNTVSYAISEPCEYEILLMDGTELEFKKNGEWKSIDMKHAAVPESIIASLPSAIPSYIESSFPGVSVEKIKKGFRNGYKIELVNDLELTFSSKGVFRRLDD